MMLAHEQRFELPSLKTSERDMTTLPDNSNKRDTAARQPLKPGLPIADLAPDDLAGIYAHPSQQRAVHRVAELIDWLRRCESPAELYEFQRHLFQDVYEADNRRAACVRIVKRLRDGKQLPADAPPPPPRGDPTTVECWEFEVFLYERLVRQFRAVGDALAWFAFGCNRRAIVALSCNPSPGPLVKRADDESYGGLPYELGCVEEFWNDRGHFTLLHDLTNCLRIADLTEFDEAGKGWLHEVKANPSRKRSAQTIRMQEAIDSIMGDGHLPGQSDDKQYVVLAEHYVTNLDQLARAMDLARKHGSRGMQLNQGRALIASSPFDLMRRCGADHKKGIEIMAAARRSALRRAGIESATHHVSGRSGDLAARSPIAVPWGIYPLSPSDCAGLICDYIVFETVVSVDALAASLSQVGLAVEVALPNGNSGLDSSIDVFWITGRNRRLKVHGPSVTPLLFELLEPDSWVRGIAELMSLPTVPGGPVLLFTDEAASWAPAALAA